MDLFWKAVLEADMLKIRNTQLVRSMDANRDCFNAGLESLLLLKSMNEGQPLLDCNTWYFDQNGLPLICSRLRWHEGKHHAHDLNSCQCLKVW